ncbi:MAG: hypothetical protein ACR2J6_04240 [Thermoleophilaceae bacterium]
MLRQRLRNRRSGLAFAGPAVTVLASLALIWGGVIVLLLALKVGASSVQAITGYRSAYDFLRGLGPDDFDSATRAILAGAGVLAFLAFGYLALKLVPRPYTARHDLDLSRGERGEVTVDPRAIERLAELAAERRAGVSAAAGRYGTDRLAVDVTLGRPRDVGGTLRGVRAAVREALERHGLPVVPVDVTLDGYQPKSRREIN